MDFNSITKTCGLFGYPVAHTLSPAMQNAAFAALRMDYVYLPFEVKPENIEAAVSAVRALGLAGVNVTIPHKVAVIPFLDRVDPLAKKIGSVNTIVNRSGKLEGFNTDGPGFTGDLVVHGFSPNRKTVILAGAGGAANAVAAVLSEARAGKIYITDLDDRLAGRLAARIPRAEHLPSRAWKKAIPAADLLVNATPVGMKPGAPLVRAAELRKGMVVYDLVYNRATELLAEARKAGCLAIDGSGMLVEQGALAFELWTGRKAPVDVMRRALRSALKKRTIRR